MNLLSCRIIQYEAYVWRMSMLSTMLTRMKIKTIICYIANSITMLPFLTLDWNKWRLTFIKESITLKLDWLGVIRNVRGHFLVISKTSSKLVVNDLLPRSNDGIGKCKRNLCMENIIFIWIYFWSGIMCFESDIIDLDMCRLLIMWIMEKRIALKKNKFRMLLL